jgi:hypothetical protein
VAHVQQIEHTVGKNQSFAFGAQTLAQTEQLTGAQNLSDHLCLTI